MKQTKKLSTRVKYKTGQPKVLTFSSLYTSDLESVHREITDDLRFCFCRSHGIVKHGQPFLLRKMIAIQELQGKSRLCRIQDARILLSTKEYLGKRGNNVAP